jgi:flagellin
LPEKFCFGPEGRRRLGRWSIKEDTFMSFSVVTNLPSLNAQARLQETSNGLQQTLNRLTSGLRINSAADDAAGLAVANRHRLDNAGLQVGIRNANDAISKLQVEDGAMGNISNLMDRALTLAAQAASDTFTGSRSTLDNEFQSVLAEITRNAQAVGLETGSASLGSRSVFIGNTQNATTANASYVSFTLTVAVDSSGLGLSGKDITTTDNAAAAVAAIQSGIGTLGNAQGTVGAAMNRLQFAITQAQTLSVSTSASESRIRDADMAQEAANLTKNNILMQSGMAALAQANQSAQSVLTLLK